MELLAERHQAAAAHQREVVGALGDFIDSLQPAQRTCLARDDHPPAAVPPSPLRRPVPCVAGGGHARHNSAMPHILLIDDDQGLAPPLRACLARFDLDLSAVRHPVEALRQARKEEPDLVILELMLPDRNWV
jgi:hypothetical protein